MDYRAALEYILSFADYERTPGARYSAVWDLGRVEALLGHLGNPHLGVRTVHIAGSKGKGSTAAMVASALSAAGYKTGLYTSPHLHALRERIAIDGHPIAEEELAGLVERITPAVEAVHGDSLRGDLTTFEVLTALAFLHFRGEGVDFQVLETGLGGRLDATNVVVPEVCLITSISFDHTETLGTTLAEIAREKAGIIKPGASVVCSPQPAEVEAVIAGACAEKGARLISLGREVTWHKVSADLRGQSLQVKARRKYDLTIPLLGEHQLENAAAAVAALEVLGVPEGAIAQGLATVCWPGRLQVLRQNPLLVVDGAHNAYSARRLREAVEGYFDFDRLIIIIGTSSDKDIAGIVEGLAPLGDEVVVTRSRHPRATDPSLIVAELAGRGVGAEVAEGVGEAVSRALTKAKSKDLILATGSLFVVAEVIESVEGLKPDFYPQSRATGAARW